MKHCQKEHDDANSYIDLMIHRNTKSSDYQRPTVSYAADWYHLARDVEAIVRSERNTSDWGTANGGIGPMDDYLQRQESSPLGELTWDTQSILKNSNGRTSDS